MLIFNVQYLQTMKLLVMKIFIMILQLRNMLLNILIILQQGHLLLLYQ